MPTNISYRYRQTQGQRGRVVQVRSHYSQALLPVRNVLDCVFTEMAVYGKILPLGCEQSPSNSNTSAELAGTTLVNISETSRQRDKQQQQQYK